MTKTPTWPNGKPRSMGPFAILYAPRSVPGTAKAPQKRGPKSVKAALKDVVNSAPAFNTPIATRADSERRVRGRGLK